MEHDDRTRAQNLARLRRPPKTPANPDQLPLPLDTRAIDLLCGILDLFTKLLALLELCDMPPHTQGDFRDLRKLTALTLDHYRDLPGHLRLSNAMRDLYAHLLPPA